MGTERFSSLLAEAEIVRRAGPDSNVTGVEYDSRRVHPGAVFVAMRGGTVDGNRYIDAAMERGAGAIVTDSAAAFDDIVQRFPTIAIAEVSHGRNALAALAARFYGHPERQLALSGITGTNGKTTTAFLLEGMLNYAGHKTVLVGTIEYHVAGEVVPSPHTTPESRDLLEILCRGLERGASEAVMEVSSHALAQGRVHGMPYDVAIFTNLTRDHLDFHGTMDAYFGAKRRLFDGALGRPPRVAVLNIDDPYGAELAIHAREAGAQIYSYGFEVGEFRAESLTMKPSGMRFTLQTPLGAAPLDTRLTGRVNVYNLLAASAAAMARGLNIEQIAQAVAAQACVPGRFQTVDAGQPFTVVVDYAHTDDALRNLTALAREFVTASGGKVLTLFGCGGERDRAKRPLMGNAAGEGSDFVMLTSDNPRGEDPLAIIADAEPGLKQTGTAYRVNPDRGKAIEEILHAARPNDIVLLAGKGHEKTQTLREGAIPFDDAQVALRGMRAMGFGKGTE